jgi:hypothetical protein
MKGFLNQIIIMYEVYFQLQILLVLKKVIPSHSRDNLGQII